jgi:hypothetical protein
MSAFVQVGEIVLTLTPQQCALLRRVAVSQFFYGFDLSEQDLAIAYGLASSDIGLLECVDGCSIVPAPQGQGYTVRAATVFNLTPLGEAVARALPAGEMPA